MTRRRPALVLHVCPVARYTAQRRRGLIHEDAAPPLHLIRLIDDTLDLLDAEPRFRHFTLDGESWLIDAYLKVRPEHFERVERLVKAGRLMIGPWYVAPEPALANVESLIRNLLIGLRTARAVGGALMVAFLPEASALHSALPQLLKGFGIQTMIGASAASDHPAEYLFRGLDGTTCVAGDLREALFSAGDTLVTIRHKLAPLSDSGHVLILTQWQAGTTAAQAAAWLRTLAEAQIALGEDGDSVIVSEPGAYARALEVNRLNSDLPTRDQRVELTAEGRAVRDWNVAISRGVVRWVEPFFAWTENIPAGHSTPLLRRPQSVIQDLWRQVLADQADPALHASENTGQREARRAFYEERVKTLRDIPLRALAEEIDTSALPIPSDKVLVVFNGSSARVAGSMQVALEAEPLPLGFSDLRAANVHASHLNVYDSAGQRVGTITPDERAASVSGLRAQIMVDVPAFGYNTYTLVTAPPEPLAGRLAEGLPTPAAPPIPRLAPTSELAALVTKPHAGTLPPSAALISVSDWRFEVTTIKPPEDSERGGVIVRGSNRVDDPLWVTITPFRPFRLCETVTLDEAPTGGKLAVDPMTGAFRFKATGHRLLTFWLHD